MSALSPKPDFSRFAFGKFIAVFMAGMIIVTLILAVPALRAASLPANATGAMLVVFSPHTNDVQAFSVIHQAGGMPVRKADFGNIWVVQAPKSGFVSDIGELGAAGVYRNLPIGIVLAGCTGVITAFGS